MQKIGILHPGEMGISLAASARNAGNEVYWASEGRSEGTRRRAQSQDLIDAGTLQGLCQACSIVVSVCPPHAAEELARQVIAGGFRGLFADANAISPMRAGSIAAEMQRAGIDFVDGGIIGGPAWKPGETWLYLSGSRAAQIAGCFSKGPLETSIIGDQPGQASALKMCYASYSKGTTALLCAAVAASEALGVREQLMQQWERDQPGLSAQALGRVTRVTAKAWRFEGEMHEIADTLRSAGLPDGFHEAAAEVFRRIAALADSEQQPELEEVLKSLLDGNEA